jgi:hypothetical protein
MALPAVPYAYLLGLYLGDGCISWHRRVWRLRIMLDTKYPSIIDRCRTAIDKLMTGQRANVMKLPKNCVEVSMNSKHWPCLRSTKYIVSIYRKADTARLDTFIGPKAIAVPWSNAHYTA